ncbi:MAG: DUF4199 family protein [Opitutales bacterium]
MKPELKYGLLGGAGVCLWILAEYCLGFHTTRLAIGEYSGYFSSLVPLVTLWLLLRGRQRVYGPLFTVLRGLSSGVMASFLTAVTVYCFLVFYNFQINPGWLDHALAWKVAQLRAAHVPEAEINGQVAFYRSSNSPAGLLYSTVAGLTLLGAFFSILISLLLIWRGQTVPPAPPSPPVPVDGPAAGS